MLAQFRDQVRELRTQDRPQGPKKGFTGQPLRELCNETSTGRDKQKSEMFVEELANAPMTM